MLFRTHIVFALAVAFLVGYFLEVPVWFFVFVLVGAAFVDIDSRKSKVGKFWGFRIFQIFVRHRGVFHSLFLAVLLSLVISGFSRWVGVGFFVGYASHLFLDCLTKSGVRLFWPLSRKKVGGFVRSGGIVEDVIFVLLLLGDIILVILYYINAY